MSAFLESLLTLELPLEAGASRHLIPGGDAGTAETISKMRELVDAGKRSPRVRELVGNLIQSCTKKDYYCYAETVFKYCRDKIQYAYDPHGVEWVESPERILDAKIADCDSICVLFASMCENLGLPCKFVTIRADKGRSDEFSHVYARVKIPRRGWIAADCTMQHDFGWEPTGYTEKEWPASNTAQELEAIDGLAEFSGGLRGMNDFASEDFDPMGNRSISVEESVLCESCPSVQPEAQVEQQFFMRERPEQNFLTGLGRITPEQRKQRDQARMLYRDEKRRRKFEQRQGSQQFRGQRKRAKFCRKNPNHPQCIFKPVSTGGPVKFDPLDGSVGNKPVVQAALPVQATVSFPGNYPYAKTPVSTGDTFVSGIAGLAGLGGLGAADYTDLAKVLDGSYGRELVAMRRTQQIRNGDLVTMEMKTSDPAKKQRIKDIAVANRAALKATMDAINQYNNVVGEIRTRSAGQIKPAVLSGLGAGPLVAAAGPLLSFGWKELLKIAIISEALTWFVNLFTAAQGKEKQVKGLVQQGTDVLVVTSDLVRNLTIAAIAGAVIYFGAKFFKQRGERSERQEFSLAKVVS